jgi:hypothetical protein
VRLCREGRRSFVITGAKRLGVVVVPARAAAPSVTAAVENIGVLNHVIDWLGMLAFVLGRAPLAAAHVGMLDVSLAHHIASGKNRTITAIETTLAQIR